MQKFAVTSFEFGILKGLLLTSEQAQVIAQISSQLTEAFNKGLDCYVYYELMKKGIDCSNIFTPEEIEDFKRRVADTEAIKKAEVMEDLFSGKTYPEDELTS